jgi:CheY-like chemotaxis protein
VTLEPSRNPWIDPNGGSAPSPVAPTFETTSSAASPGRLLVVDDSLVTVDVVSDFMQDQGWNVETALSAAQALVKLSSFKPEVVVSDLNMPDLDGLGLFKRIRQVDATVPVIMLSGEDKLESVLASMHAGVFDFVQKRDCIHTLPAAALRAVAPPGRTSQDRLGVGGRHQPIAAPVQHEHRTPHPVHRGPRDLGSPSEPSERAPGVVERRRRVRVA